MASIKKPLLTIAIPTYNRAKYLNSCLQSIFLQLDEDMDVEVVVSNNCSTDDTDKVLERFSDKKRFKYFQQKDNIGFARNVLSSVKLASGEFCWVIGDDDFLAHGALRAVLGLLADNESVDYYYASVKGIHVDVYNSYTEPFTTFDLGSDQFIKDLDYQRVDKFENLITPKYSIIFLGELMASIFRREIWMRYKETEEFEKAFLDNLETTYPHTVVLANTFLNSDVKAIYIKTPLLICLDGAREWWDKLGYILVVHVKELLDLYKRLGVSKQNLAQCYDSYLHMSFKYFLKFLISPKSKYKDKIKLSKYAFFLLENPILCLSFFYTVAVGKTKVYLRGKR